MVRRNYFTVRVIKCQNRLSEWVIDSASLEIIKTQRDTVLSSLLQVALLSAGGLD